MSFYIECIFDLGTIIAWWRLEVGPFRHHHSGKTRTMALFWLRTLYHAQRYMLRFLLTQSVNIVNTPIILLFSKKWAPGSAAEDNRRKEGYRISPVWAPTLEWPSGLEGAPGQRGHYDHLSFEYCKLTNFGVLLYLANLASCVFSLIFVAANIYVDRTLHRRAAWRRQI